MSKNTKIANKSAIEADKKATNIKNIKIDQEYQEYIFNHVEKTYQVKTDIFGKDVDLAFDSVKNIVIDIKEESILSKRYKNNFKCRLNRLNKELEKNDLTEEQITMLSSLKSSLTELNSLEFDNIHIVYEKANFLGKRQIEVEFGGHKQVHETPFIHVMEVTMLSDYKKLQYKVKQIIKQLYFITEQFSFMNAYFNESLNLYTAIMSDNINLYATIVSGHQFSPDEPNKFKTPEGIFNMLLKYQDKTILDCFRFNKILKPMGEHFKSTNLTSELKERKNINPGINHVCIFNPYSQTEMVQIVDKINYRFDNVDQSLHTINQFITKQNKWNDNMDQFVNDQKKWNNNMDQFVKDQRKWNENMDQFVNDQKKWNENMDNKMDQVIELLKNSHDKKNKSSLKNINQQTKSNTILINEKSTKYVETENKDIADKPNVKEEINKNIGVQKEIILVNKSITTTKKYSIGDEDNTESKIN